MKQYRLLFLFLFFLSFNHADLFSQQSSSRIDQELDAIPKSEFIYEGSQIRLRHFFYHNSAGLLVKTIMDDGSQQDPDCLEGVTERHITHIAYSFECPVLPAIQYLQEAYLDLQTNQERQLKRTEHVYNEQGQLIEQKIYGTDDLYAYSLYFSYDAQGRPLSRTEADGSKKTYTYDSKGNLIAQATLFANGRQLCKRYQYDADQRLIQEDEEQRDGSQSIQASYIYDAAGHKITSYDQYGNATFFEYDQHGHMIAAIQPEVLDVEGNSVHPVWKYAYDEKGQLISSTDPNGFETRTVYEEHGKPALVLYPDGSVETFTYDTSGAVQRCTTKNKSYTDYTRDYLGRVLRTQTYAADGTPDIYTRNTYNAFHLLSQEDDAGNLTLYQYDQAGRLLSVVQQSGQGEKIIAYTYDSLGQLQTSKETAADKSDEAIVTRTVRGSDNAIKEVRLEDLQGNLIKSHTYSEKNAKQENSGEILEVFLNDRGQYVKQTLTADEEGGITVTTYDALGRIEKMSRKGLFGNTISQLDFRYDLAGNKIKETKTIFPQTEVQAIEITVWRYGPNNRIEEVIEKESTPQQQHTYYHYGSWGQLEVVAYPNDVVHYHSYDECGRLIEQLASDQTFHFMYVYDHGKLSMVRDLKNGQAHSGAQLEHQQAEASGFSWKETWNSLAATVNKSWKTIKDMTYKALYLLNFEVSVVNFITQQFEALAQFILGKGFFDILGYHTHPIITGTYGEKEVHPKVRITLINGILNLRGDHHEVLNMISKSHGGCRLHYVFRANHGWTGDLARCAMSKMGVISNEARMLAQLWRQMIAEMGGLEGGGMIIHYAHSIGGTETDSARRLLTPAEQKMINIITFGSATIVPNDNFQSVVNYVSRRDGVSLLDPKSYIRGLMDDETNIVFLGTYLNIPFVDHTLLGDTYKNIIEMLGKEFVEAYLRN